MIDKINNFYVSFMIILIYFNKRLLQMFIILFIALRLSLISNLDRGINIIL